jgi:hypothetical protein
MKWFQQVQRRIRSLKEQNTGGGKTEYDVPTDMPKFLVDGLDSGRTTHDGYQRRSLQEGYIEKGGKNPPQSQVQVRPPPPAPLRPASSQGDSEQQETTNRDRISTQKLIGSTEHFTIYTVSPTTHKLFMVMPRTSMYIDVDEARQLYKLLLTSITAYIERD